MTKSDILYKLTEEYNGYLIVEKALNRGVSKPIISEYVKKMNMERAAHGIYICDDIWPDELFILQNRNKAIIYTGQTALYLHGLIDREYNKICFSVPTGYNASHIKAKSKEVHYENPTLYGLGLCEIVSSSGNKIKVYNKERCICELIQKRKKYEIQTYQTAIKEYMSMKDKDLSLLIEFAEKLKIRDEVMKYVEVLV